MATLIGQTVSHYKILARLGGGGMGVVYKAEDTRLKRTVALKFLPPDLTRETEAKERFIREAQAASALQHNNICTVHDVEETPDGDLYIVMDFYEGETLREKCARGPLPINEAVDFALQVSQGLQKAHEKGMVHRDIKPANILVTGDGVAKILDFGVAKLAGATLVTTERSTIGTVAYMSPEQARGNPVDQRSDLWSLGVVLYQMITGERPFRSEYPEAVVYSLLNEPVTPPTAVRNEVSRELERVTLHLLEKDPKNRYQNAPELIEALQGCLAGGAPGRGRLKIVTSILKKPSALITGTGIALAAVIILFATGILHRWFGGNPLERTPYLGVLPFVSIGGDSTDRFLAQGVLEGVVSGLTQMQTNLQGTQVCPAGETRSYRDVREARKGSGITLAIEGSIQWLPKQIWATVTLVDAEKLSTIDSREVRLSSASFLDLESRLVSSILEMISRRPGQADLQKLTVGTTKDEGAYQDYLRARGILLESPKPEAGEKARELLQRAIQKDSLYTLAYAGLGEAYWREYAATRDVRWADSAISACAHAARLDAGLPEVHFTLGLIYHGTGRDSLALLQYQLILSGDSSNARAYVQLGEVYASLGDPEKAEAAFRKAVALRSSDWLVYYHLGLFYYRAERDSEAVAAWKIATALAPDRVTARNGLGAVYFRQDRWNDAVEQFSHALQIDSSNALLYCNLGTAYYYDGLYERAARAYDRALSLSGSDYEIWGGRAAAYQALGSKKLAHESYESAARLAEGMLKVNPRDPEVLSILAGDYASLGRKAEARLMIRKALLLGPKEKRTLNSAVSTFELLGDREQALKYLREALSEGADLTEIKWSPEMKALREDPQYRKMIQGH